MAEDGRGGPLKITVHIEGNVQQCVTLVALARALESEKEDTDFDTASYEIAPALYELAERLIEKINAHGVGPLCDEDSRAIKALRRLANVLEKEQADAA
jgi:hypothetical protein